MSLAATRVALTHRCTIDRDEASVDDWGQIGPPDWQRHLNDVPCYASVSAAREPVDADRTVVVEDLRMVVNRDVDVTERDRVGAADVGRLLH